MKGIFRILLGLVGAVVVLLILAGVLLPLIYDEEDLKQAIVTEVKRQTGRDLSINGALDFSVFPWLAVEVSDLSLGNAEGFADRPFARIDEARVGVALLPLLRKQVAVDEITLDGLELDLAVNASGENNWDDLSAASESESKPSMEAEDSRFSAKRVAGLNIRDARISFQDQQTGSDYRLSGFSMQTGALGDGKPVPLELAALLEDLAAGTSATISLSATTLPDLQAERYRFDDLELALTPGAPESMTALPALRIRAPRVDSNLAAQTLEIDAFQADLANLRATGDLSASHILEDPAVSGSISVAEFSPAELMLQLQMVPPATADPDALQKARFGATFAGSPSNLNLRDLEFDLDQSRFTGEMNLKNFDQPKVGFVLTVDKIDLDRYLEPASDAAGQENVAMPREELRGHELEGQISIGEMRLAGLDFSDAVIGISIRDGRLRVNPLTANFYGGSYKGDITLDSKGAVPVLSLDEKIESVSFQRLLADLLETESLSGTAIGHLRLTGHGGSSDEVLNSLSGDLGLSLAEGALEGINVWHEIRRGMALYKGLEPPPAEPNRTVFSRLKLTASVEDGVVSTRELVGELPFLTVSGNGRVDLGQSQVDLKLLAAVHNAPELANDPLGAELRGKSLPFRVSGPLDKPSISLDFEALLKSEAADMLLKKLGVVPAAESGQETEGEQQPASTEDQLKKAAEGALFDLLRGKDKEKDKKDQ